MNTLNKIKEVTKYLETMPTLYVSGWLACLTGYRHSQISEDKKIQNLFDQGYGDCFANGESEPVDYDRGYDEYKEERAGFFEEIKRREQ